MLVQLLCWFGSQLLKTSCLIMHSWREIPNGKTWHNAGEKEFYRETYECAVCGWKRSALAGNRLTNYEGWYEAEIRN